MVCISYISKSAQACLAILAVVVLLRVEQLCRSTIHERSSPTPVATSLFGLLWPSDPVSDVLAFDNATANSTDVLLESHELFSRVIVRECVSVPLFSREFSAQPEAGVSQSAFSMFRKKMDDRLVPVLVLVIKAILCIVHMLFFIANRTTATSFFDYAFFVLSLLLVCFALILLLRMQYLWAVDWQTVEDLVMDYPWEWKLALIIVIALFILIITDFLFRHMVPSSVRVVRHRRSYRPRRRSRESAETDSLFGPVVQPYWLSESQSSCAQPPVRPATTRSSFNLSHTNSFRQPAPVSTTLLNTDAIPRPGSALVESDCGSPPPPRVAFQHDFYANPRRTSSLSESNDINRKTNGITVPPTPPEHRI